MYTVDSLITILSKESRSLTANDWNNAAFYLHRAIQDTKYSLVTKNTTNAVNCCIYACALAYFLAKPDIIPEQYFSNHVCQNDKTFSFDIVNEQLKIVSLASCTSNYSSMLNNLVIILCHIAFNYDDILNSMDYTND